MEQYEERRKELIKRFDALRAEAKEDAVINKLAMENQFDCSMKIAKWLDKRANWNELCRGYEFKRMEAWKKAFEYYKKDYPFTINNQDEYRNLIGTDPVYSQIADLARIASDVVDFIDKTIENMKQRHWEIRSILEYWRWKNGQ